MHVSVLVSPLGVLYPHLIAHHLWRVSKRRDDLRSQGIHSKLKASRLDCALITTLPSVINAKYNHVRHESRMGDERENMATLVIQNWNQIVTEIVRLGDLRHLSATG